MSYFFGLQNFINGSNLHNQIEDSLNYAKLPYIPVTIESNMFATKQIYPSAYTYENRFKKSDSINLSFETTDNYQFTRWIVESDEEDAVEFIKDEFSKTNPQELKNTKIVIKKNVKEIKIYPEVMERPTLSAATIFPSNTKINEKNSSIKIEYKNKLNFPKESLGFNFPLS